VAGISLGGLASGLDTETMITQLMALEAQPKTLLQNQQKKEEARKTALEDVARQMRALSTAVTDLRSALTWGNVQKATSSDETKVSASITGTGAPAGAVTVDVHQLARAEQRTYDYTKSNVTINGKSVDLTATADAAEAAKKINETDGVGVYAGVVNNKLVLTSRELGGAITQAGMNESAPAVLGQLTQYSVNGVRQTDTNKSVVEAGGLPGIQLTLKAVGSSTLSVTPPGVDPEKVKGKVEAFVSAYNATIETVNTKLTEQKVKNATTQSDMGKGILRGDSQLQSLLSQLRSNVTKLDSTPGVLDSFSELGIGVAKATESGTTTADGKLGKITLDATKLTAALSADPAAVRNALGGSGVDGLSQGLDKVLDPIGKAATGYIARSKDSADEQIKRITTRVEDFDRRLTKIEERYRKQFASLETALNSSQSQQSWLSGQINSLPSWN